MKREIPKPLRCAIYTRVSTEHGLEQEFNSLDNQREAAEAYIKSQAHEGWRGLRERYDDGGFSGGSMERPALQKLLSDIQARRIDVVVVYKVDRLTRSLTDFARLVELLPRAGRAAPLRSWKALQRHPKMIGAARTKHCNCLEFRFTSDVGRACMRSPRRETDDAERDAHDAAERERSRGLFRHNPPSRRAEPSLGARDERDRTNHRLPRGGGSGFPR